MTNTAIWDALGKTDPNQTKGFSRAGGFKGTAVKPIWIQRRLTEQFGPAGEGWGVNKPEFQVVPGDGEILVYCTVSAWHGNRENVLWGVGGDKVLTKRNDGKAFHDDEAFKKAFTDAVGNAFKSIGIAADIHMGLFDDDKYVSAAREEFSGSAVSSVLSDAQQGEIIAMCESMNVAIGDFLAVGNWSSLPEVPAEQFELGKRWINKKARERAAQKETA